MNHYRIPYKSILLVCSVNTARSPMAEGFLKDFISKNKLDIKVNSCGIASNARDGMLISLDAKLAMKEIGIELSNNSVSIDLKKHLDLLNDVDLILTFTENHKKELIKLINPNGKAIYTVKEFAGETGDIEDPSMKGIKGFRKVRDEIKKYIYNGLKSFKV